MTIPSQFSSSRHYLWLALFPFILLSSPCFQQPLHCEEIESKSLSTTSGADLPSLAPSQFDAAAAKHLLNRAGFGGTPDEIDRLVQLGLDKAVETLLDSKDPDPLQDFEPTLMTLFWHGHFATLHFVKCVTHTICISKTKL